jgi:RHS repeat-associated protein
MNLRCTYTTNPTPTLYTGQQHDPESGLDDFHARYYGAARNVGRFMTADPSGKGAAELEDPQTWNLYAYVRNNPMTLTDPSGLAPLTPDPASNTASLSLAAAGAGGWSDAYDQAVAAAAEDAAAAQNQPATFEFLYATISNDGIMVAHYAASGLVLEVDQNTIAPNDPRTDVVEVDRTYWVHSKDGSHFGPVLMNHDISGRETQTGGNSKPSLLDPNHTEHFYTDSIYVGGKGQTFQVRQTWYIDGHQATIFNNKLDSKGNVVSGRTVYIDAAAERINVTLGP